MNGNIELLYKDRFSPIRQFIYFLILHIVAFVATLALDIQPIMVWVIFQTMLFFFSTTSIVLGIFTENNPKHYYPMIIVFNIFFFFMGKYMAQIASGTTLDDYEYLKNFVLLNILFFFIFLTASLIYRGVKQKLENM